MPYSPGRPSNTMQILFSGEMGRRVVRRMFFTAASAGASSGNFLRRAGASSSFPRHCDEAPTLLGSQPQICAIGAVGRKKATALITLVLDEGLDMGLKEAVHEVVFQRVRLFSTVTL